MARRAPTLLLVALLASVTLAGCFGASSLPVRAVAYLPLQDAEPGRATEFAFYVESASSFRQDLPVGTRGLPEGWVVEPERAVVELPGGASTSLVVRVTPPLAAAYGPQPFELLVGEAAAPVIVNVRDLGEEPLRAGIGTRLHYVGWYDNGTLFGWSDPALVGRPIPYFAPGGGENATVPPSEGFDVLKVYVGGTRGTPPPEPYNSSGYVPVITGFDARLRDAGDGRGMVEGETLTVRVPKEQAYTIAGREDHVLYGENLNFLIRIVSVDELQTRACTLPVCPPAP